MDISGVQALLSVIKKFYAQGIDIVICGVPKSTMAIMRRSGIAELLGENNFYWSVERALLENRPYRHMPTAL